MSLVPIRSLDDPRLDVYRGLKRSNLTRWSGRFIAEGAKVLDRLLASDFPVESVLVRERRVEQLFPTAPEDVPVLVISQELAEQLVGYNFHTGVLACGRRKPALDLDALLRNAAAPVTLVACPNVDDPTIRRTSERSSASVLRSASTLCCSAAGAPTRSRGECSGSRWEVPSGCRSSSATTSAAIWSLFDLPAASS